MHRNCTIVCTVLTHLVHALLRHKILTLAPQFLTTITSDWWFCTVLIILPTTKEQQDRLLDPMRGRDLPACFLLLLWHRCHHQSFPDLETDPQSVQFFRTTKSLFWIHPRCCEIAVTCIQWWSATSRFFCKFGKNVYTTWIVDTTFVVDRWYIQEIMSIFIHFHI